MLSIRKTSPARLSGSKPAKARLRRVPIWATAAALMAPAGKAELFHCHMLMDLASSELGHLQASAVSALDEGCRFDQIASEGLPGARPALLAQSLTVQGAGFAEMIEEAQPTRSLSLEIKGLELQPASDPGLPRWEVLLLSRDKPLDLRLSYLWDEASSQVQITALDVDFGPEGRLHLTGTLDKVDLRSADMAAVSVGGMGLTDLTVDFTSQGIFEALLLPLFGPKMLDEFATPEAGIEVLKASALAALAKVPVTILDPDSLEAMSGFVADLPAPSGQLRLTLEALPGLGAPRFFGFAMTGVPRDAERFWAAFQGVTARAEWQPGLAVQ